MEEEVKHSGPPPLAKQDQSLAVRGKSDAEIVMETVNSVAKNMLDTMRETRKHESDNDTKIEMHRDELKHKASIVFHNGLRIFILVVAVLGLSGAWLSYLISKPDFIPTIIGSTVSGILGLLAGNGMSQKKED